MFAVSAESTLLSLAYCNYFAPSVQNNAMHQICPDKSCYDCAVIFPFYLILKYRETIFTQCFHLLFYLRAELFYPAVQLMRIQGLVFLPQKARPLFAWYPSYEDMYEPFPFLPPLKLKKKCWDRWMQYQCSKGHEVKCCERFANLVSGHKYFTQC